MKISVYITSYNQKNYLVEAIDSVLAQTVKASQIIVVDDCSSDGSQELIESYVQRHPDLIVPIYHKKNQGVANTRNSALKAITGDFFTYLDGDDRYLSNKLEKQLETFDRNRSAQVVFCNDYYIDPNGNRIGIWIEEGIEPPEGNLFVDAFAINFPKNKLYCMEMVNRAAWEKIGFYDEKLKIYEDWELLLRLAKKYHVAYCDEPLTETRLHGDGLSNLDYRSKLEAIEYIRRKHKNFLTDLTYNEINFINRNLDHLSALLARRTANQKLLEKNRIDALRNCCRSLGYQWTSPALKLLLRTLLTEPTYKTLRAFFRNSVIASSGANS